jgi:predicted amidophosphoribosyltransferase
MESMQFGSQAKPHILTNSALAKQRKVCGVCQLRPRMAGANWCEQCRDAYNVNLGPKPKRKRGNPNWPKQKAASVLEKPTAFDNIVRDLGLKVSEFDHSPELAKWIRKNRNSKYVPEWLLMELGIEVDDKYFC